MNRSLLKIAFVVLSLISSLVSFAMHSSYDKGTPSYYMMPLNKAPLLLLKNEEENKIVPLLALPQEIQYGIVASIYRSEDKNNFQKTSHYAHRLGSVRFPNLARLAAYESFSPYGLNETVLLLHAAYNKLDHIVSSYKKSVVSVDGGGCAICWTVQNHFDSDFKSYHIDLFTLCCQNNINTDGINKVNSTTHNMPEDSSVVDPTPLMMAACWSSLDSFEQELMSYIGGSTIDKDYLISVFLLAAQVKDVALFERFVAIVKKIQNNQTDNLNALKELFIFHLYLAKTVVRRHLEFCGLLLHHPSYNLVSKTIVGLVVNHEMLNGYVLKIENLSAAQLNDILSLIEDADFYDNIDQDLDVSLRKKFAKTAIYKEIIRHVITAVEKKTNGADSNENQYCLIL